MHVKQGGERMEQCHKWIPRGISQEPEYKKTQARANTPKIRKEGLEGSGKEKIKDLIMPPRYKFEKSNQDAGSGWPAVGCLEKTAILIKHQSQTIHTSGN